MMLGKIYYDPNANLYKILVEFDDYIKRTKSEIKVSSR